jgi:hypothetical protein
MWERGKGGREDRKERGRDEGEDRGREGWTIERRGGGTR